MTERQEPGNDQVWEDGWADHERRQMMRLAGLPLSEKLKWLEEAQRLVLQMGVESTGEPDR